MMRVINEITCIRDGVGIPNEASLAEKRKMIGNHLITWLLCHHKFVVIHSTDVTLCICL